MCYRPLHIRNASNHYDATCMPLFFDVPCGDCEECREQMRSQWFVRSYYHWLYYKTYGGVCYFYTLTYNNEHLPSYNGINCFSRRDVQLFCKRLKERLRKLGVKLDYLITCEFGERFKRSHLHALFFVSKNLGSWKFYHLLEDCWQNGFVYSGQDGGIVNSSSGILYVTKYVCKDSSFVSLDKRLYASLKRDYSELYSSWMHDIGEELGAPLSFDDLLREHRLFVGNEEVIAWYNAFMKEYRSRCPFCAHSSKLGYSLINHPHCLLEKDSVLIPQKTGWNNVPLPRYISRNIFYDRVPNEKDGKLTRYVLNEKGKIHLLETLDDRIEQKALDYKNFFSSVSISPDIFDNLKTHFIFDDVKDLNFFLKHLSLDWRKMAIYSCVYRNRVNILSSDFDFFKDYKSFLSDCLFETENDGNVSIASMFPKQLVELEKKLFNFLPNFEIYEQVLLLHSHLVSLIRSERSSQKVSDTKKQRELKDILIKLPKMLHYENK